MNCVKQRSRSRADSQAGFTLLELLVAIALLGLIAALLGSGLQLGAASRDRVVQTAGELEDLRVIDTFLRQRLTAVLPYVSGRRGDLATVRFEGDEETVRFLVASVFRDETRGIRELRIALDKAPRGNSLVADDAPWGVDVAAAAAPAARYVLLDTIARATFSYYGANPAHSAPGWHRQWRNATALPDLIRIDLIPLDSSLSWPAITVAPVLARTDR